MKCIFDHNSMAGCVLFIVFSGSCGMILNTQGKHNRQNFEIQLNILKELEQNQQRKAV